MRRQRPLDDDAEAMLSREQLDFVDIITEVPAHAPLVEMAAKYRVPVICQKPMAADFETACGMVDACRTRASPSLSTRIIAGSRRSAH